MTTSIFFPDPIYAVRPRPLPFRCCAYALCQQSRRHRTFSIFQDGGRCNSRVPRKLVGALCRACTRCEFPCWHGTSLFFSSPHISNEFSTTFSGTYFFDASNGDVLFFSSLTDIPFDLFGNILAPPPLKVFPMHLRDQVFCHFSSKKANPPRFTLSYFLFTYCFPRQIPGTRRFFTAAAVSRCPSTRSYRTYSPLSPVFPLFFPSRATDSSSTHRPLARHTALGSSRMTFIDPPDLSEVRMRELGGLGQIFPRN